MGIHSEFNYGIALHTFSFAFSNLNFEFEKKEREIEKIDLGFKFLGAFSKEMMESKIKKGIAKKNKILTNYALTSL